MEKKSLGNRFITFWNPLNWQIKTQIITAIVVILIITAEVLSFYVPTQEQFDAKTSASLQQAIKEDEGKVNKSVIQTYNKLWFVAYVSITKTGAETENQKFVGFAGQIYEADEGAISTVGQMINYTYRLLGCGENVLHGAKLTIFLTVTSMIVGFLLSIFLALGKMSKHKLISKPCSAYIFFFRGTPLMIQLFTMYFMIPEVFGFAWKNVCGGDVYWGAFVAAWISFTLNTAAYCAEIVRAAIQSIDKGQNEAAKALGMTYGKTMSLIIIPQSIRRLIPPVCNEFVMLLKDASLVFAISLMDITTISKNIMSQEGGFLVFIPALIIYLIITAFFTFIFNKIEKKFSVYD